MFLKYDDADFFVSRFGSGARTFVAHGGWVGSGELWQQPFELMSGNMQTLTYDHRGTGATRHRGPLITFDMLVNDLFRVLDACHISKCVLAGESSGVLVVLEAALRQPERFSALVLVDGRAASSNTSGAARFIEGCKNDFPSTMRTFVDACIPETDCQAEKEWALNIVMRSNGADAVSLMEAVWEARVHDRLEQVKQPTLLIHGRQDKITPVSASEEMAARIPDAKLVVIDDAGHVPVITRPRRVVEEIEAFLKDRGY